MKDVILEDIKVDKMRSAGKSVRNKTIKTNLNASEFSKSNVMNLDRSALLKAAQISNDSNQASSKFAALSNKLRNQHLNKRKNVVIPIVIPLAVPLVIPLEDMNLRVVIIPSIIPLNTAFDATSNLIVH
jgi:hypothetical protein